MQKQETSIAQKKEMFKPYKDFVRSKPAAAKGFENLIKAIGFLIPSSLGERDFFTELGYALSRVLGYMHDSILASSPANIHPELRCNWQDEDICNLLGSLLAIISLVEVISEKGTEKFAGARAKWRLIRNLERFKAVTRLIILYKKQAMLINGEKIAPRRNRHSSWQPTNRRSSTESPLPQTTMRNPLPGVKQYVGTRSGLKLSGMSSTEENREAKDEELNVLQREKNSTTHPLPEPITSYFCPRKFGKDHPATVGKGLFLVGEVFNIVRPVLYTELRSLQGETWAPLVISGLVDLLGFCASSKSLELPLHPGVCQLQSLKTKEEELSRRKMLWLLYLMRSPIFKLVTAPAADGINSTLGQIPLLGYFVRYAVSLLLYFQRHHFYTSGS